MANPVTDSTESWRRYTYIWRNNSKRATLFGRTCRVLARAKTMNSRLIEFDNGQREVVSGNALRKISNA